MRRYAKHLIGDVDSSSVDGDNEISCYELMYANLSCHPRPNLSWLYLGGDGDSRVDGVGDNEDHSLGASLCAGSDQVAHNGAVGVEKVVARHAWLAGDASRDHNHLVYVCVCVCVFVCVCV